MIVDHFTKDKKCSVKIEKAWFRSICTEFDNKKPERAKIAKQMFGAQKDSKNAYVLMEDKDQAATVAKDLNQTKFMEKHLRFDLAVGSAVQGRVRKNAEKVRVGVEDFNTSVFIGNLPFIISEEELRSHFEPHGKIQNVRLVRDPKTHVGRGIGYVQYSTQEEMKVAMEKLNDSKLKGREIRVKRAVEPKRREKKERKKQEAQADRK